MNIATSQSQFDAAWNAAQPKEVQALMAQPAPRAQQAAKLVSAKE